MTVSLAMLLGLKILQPGRSLDKDLVWYARIQINVSRSCASSSANVLDDKRLTRRDYLQLPRHRRLTVLSGNCGRSHILYVNVTGNPADKYRIPIH